MASKIATAYVEIRTDQQTLNRELSGLKRTLPGSFPKINIPVDTAGLSGAQEMAGKLKGTLLALSTLGAVIAAKHFVNVASDAQEIQGKFEAVFKNLSADATKFAETFSKEVGRSVIDTKEQLASFQDLFVPLGFARKEASELSKSLTRLAVDLASFNNISDKSAQESLSSALVGNHEAVRKFGIVLTEVSLNQELLNRGIAGGSEKATEQEKVMARLAIILKSTSDAQGDATRTAGDYANQLKRTQGEIKDMEAEIGAKLMPVFAKMLTLTSSLVKEFTELDKATQGTASQTVVLTGAAVAGVIAFNQLKTAIGGVAAITTLGITAALAAAVAIARDLTHELRDKLLVSMDRYTKIAQDAAEIQGELTRKAVARADDMADPKQRVKILEEELALAKESVAVAADRVQASKDQLKVDMAARDAQTKASELADRFGIYGPTTEQQGKMAIAATEAQMTAAEQRLKTLQGKLDDLKAANEKAENAPVVAEKPGPVVKNPWEDKVKSLRDQVRLLRGDITETGLAIEQMMEAKSDPKLIGQFKALNEERDRLIKAKEKKADQEQQVKQIQAAVQSPLEAAIQNILRIKALVTADMLSPETALKAANLEIDKLNPEKKLEPRHGRIESVESFGNTIQTALLKMDDKIPKEQLKLSQRQTLLLEQANGFLQKINAKKGLSVFSDN